VNAPDLKKIPPIKMGTTISGTITVKDPQQLKNLNQSERPTATEKPKSIGFTEVQFDAGYVIG